MGSRFVGVPRPSGSAVLWGPTSLGSHIRRILHCWVLHLFHPASLGSCVCWSPQLWGHTSQGSRIHWGAAVTRSRIHWAPVSLMSGVHGDPILLGSHVQDISNPWGPLSVRPHFNGILYRWGAASVPSCVAGIWCPLESIYEVLGSCIHWGPRSFGAFMGSPIHGILCHWSPLSMATPYHWGPTSRRSHAMGSPVHGIPFHWPPGSMGS